MELGPILLFGFMWLVINAIRKAGSKPPGAPRTPARPPQGSPQRTSARPGARPGSLPPVTGGDATQREGSRLEDLFRELGRALEQGSGPAGRAPDRRLPPAEEVEELASLEEEAPEVQSLETAPRRTPRVRVAQDDQAAQVIARRLEAAEAHGKELTRADHRTFDARIRQEPADKTATAAYTARQLRDAVVWREILGPPLSLRGKGRSARSAGESP